MTKTRRHAAYVVVYLIGLVLLAVFVLTPVNKYEWMRQAGVETLPDDPDQAMRLAIVALPLCIVAAAILWLGIRSDSRTLRLSAMGYVLVTAIVAVAKSLG